MRVAICVPWLTGAVLAAVPVLANTRTGMVAVALTLPLTLAPLSLKKRLIAVAVLVVAGLLVFQMEHIKSIFRPGHHVGCGDRCAGNVFR